MKEVLQQAKKVGGTTVITSGGREYSGKIEEIYEDVVSLIIAEQYSPDGVRLTQQTKAVILTSSITCIVISVNA